MDEKSLKTELIKLYECTREKSRRFQRKTYRNEIESLQKEYCGLLNDVRQEAECSSEAMEQMAEIIPAYVAEVLGRITSRRKREMEAIEYNLAMVSFFLPLLGEIPGKAAKELTEKSVEIWNTMMPENKIGHSTVEKIESGFKKGIFCYITSAVCQSLQKPDDCYELMLLREYRDTYLLQTEDGKELIREYYNIAPTIVKRINKESTSEEIYRKIWDAYLMPCIRLIEEGKQDACKTLYTEMVHDLEKKYVYSKEEPEDE